MLWGGGYRVGATGWSAMGGVVQVLLWRYSPRIRNSIESRKMDGFQKDEMFSLVLPPSTGVRPEFRLPVPAEFVFPLVKEGYCQWEDKSIILVMSPFVSNYGRTSQSLMARACEQHIRNGLWVIANGNIAIDIWISRNL